jgi:hypothetical protein
MARPATTSMEPSKSRADQMHGLTLAEAFRKHVLEDGEVVATGCQVCAAHPADSAVFLKGNYPGDIVDYHWPVNANAEDIAYAFVRSMLVLDRPQPEPSIWQIAASKVLAARLSELVGYLARGEMIAVGTFGASGIEAPIGIGQWRRNDLWIDIENSSVCETRNYKPAPLWTGVWLRTAEQSPTIGSIAGEGARKLSATKTKPRDEMLNWLRSIMSDPDFMPLTNAELWKEIERRWPEKISHREFVRCRGIAVAELNDDQRSRWVGPGPKPRS